MLPIDGAVITVIGSSGNRELGYSTNSVAEQLDELQFVVGEGPCIDAFFQLVPVLVDDLAAQASIRRWPGFAVAALEAGACAIFAFPLHAGPTRFGVLELYRSVAGGLSDEDLSSALWIAASAVQVVLADVTASMTQISSRNSDYGRADIHRATGMIAAQLNVSISEALSRLRAAAFAEQ